MDRNVGGFDRIWRIVFGIVLLVVGYRNRNRTVGTLAFVAGSDIFATAIIQRCPMNALLGIDTCGTDG
ncbi:YgaP family membrane protein [Natronorubrum sp. DTA7]|uniref:YgaP family membrane protein n=1 Tax=Natronorubrum sp. DTA7 TaxID=3447016 RepID=UPI003F86F351